MSLPHRLSGMHVKKAHQIIFLFIWCAFFYSVLLLIFYNAAGRI